MTLDTVLASGRDLCMHAGVTAAALGAGAYAAKHAFKYGERTVPYAIAGAAAVAAGLIIPELDIFDAYLHAQTFGSAALGLAGAGAIGGAIGYKLGECEPRGSGLAAALIEKTMPIAMSGLGVLIGTGAYATMYIADYLR
jgi:hypothetical protein